MRLMATYFRTGAGAARIMNIVQRKLWRPGEMSDQEDKRNTSKLVPKLTLAKPGKRSCQ